MSLSDEVLTLTEEHKIDPILSGKTGVIGEGIRRIKAAGLLLPNDVVFAGVILNKPGLHGQFDKARVAKGVTGKNFKVHPVISLAHDATPETVIHEYGHFFDNQMEIARTGKEMSGAGEGYWSASQFPAWYSSEYEAYREDFAKLFAYLVLHGNTASVQVDDHKFHEWFDKSVREFASGKNTVHAR